MDVNFMWHHKQHYERMKGNKNNNNKINESTLPNTNQNKLRELLEWLISCASRNHLIDIINIK